MFFAAVQHSVYYYVVGFIVAFAMIARGIMLIVQGRKAKKARAEEKAAAANAAAGDGEDKGSPDAPGPPPA